MNDFQPYVKDIRWLFFYCKRLGLPNPDGSICEDFKERVAIMMVENGWSEGVARIEAFNTIRDKFNKPN